MSDIVNVIETVSRSTITVTPSKASNVPNNIATGVNGQASKAAISSKVSVIVVDGKTITTTIPGTGAATETQKDESLTKSASTNKSATTSAETSKTDESTSSSTSTTPSTLVTSTTPSVALSQSLAQPTATTIASEPPPNQIHAGPHVPIAGVVVASILGFMAFCSLLFLICRYCPPVRRRLDTWQDRKREARTYREGIDGVALSADKLSVDGSPKPTFGNSRFYGQHEPSGHLDTGAAQNSGLGLGHRLSLLRQHSPFNFSMPAGHRPQTSFPSSNPRDRDLPALPR